MIDRFLRRVLGQVLLNRISKRTLRPFAINSDITKFALTIDQISLSFFAVTSACTFTQTPVTLDTFVDVPDVGAIRALPL